MSSATSYGFIVLEATTTRLRPTRSIAE